MNTIQPAPQMVSMVLGDKKIVINSFAESFFEEFMVTTKSRMLKLTTKFYFHWELNQFMKWIPGLKKPKKPAPLFLENRGLKSVGCMVAG